MGSTSHSIQAVEWQRAKSASQGCIDGQFRMVCSHPCQQFHNDDRHNYKGKKKQKNGLILKINTPFLPRARSRLFAYGRNVIGTTRLHSRPGSDLHCCNASTAA
jgi:hypothetical protein